MVFDELLSLKDAIERTGATIDINNTMLKYYEVLKNTMIKSAGPVIKNFSLKVLRLFKY